MSKQPKIFIVRHCDYKGNDSRGQGVLTEEGIISANMIADKINEIAPSENHSAVILTSPKIRAIQTSITIATKLDCEIWIEEFVWRDDSEKTLDFIKSFGKTTDTIVIVGHMILVEKLPPLLCESDDSYVEERPSKGDCFFINLSEKNWKKL